MVNKMTAHELLNFLDRQKKFYEQTFPERRGAQAWPTRRETVFNLNLNREWFPNDRKVMASSFIRVFTDCRRRGLVEQRGCTPSCHARHVVVTPKGLAQLAIWRANGCPSCDDHGDRLDKVVMQKGEVA